jgi:hypothetical protein
MRPRSWIRGVVLAGWSCAFAACQDGDELPARWSYIHEAILVPDNGAWYDYRW